MRNFVEGYYKGRKVALSYSTSENNSNSFGPSIEPRIIVKRKFFLFDNPSVTENTKLISNKIYYTEKGFYENLSSAFAWGNIRLYSGEEFLMMLEELTLAAEKLERNPE
jgi:hypothetical protein